MLNPLQLRLDSATVVGVADSIIGVEDVAAVSLRGLGSREVSLLGVPLREPRSVPWDVDIALGVFSPCPLLAGGEVVTTLRLSAGALRVDLGPPGASGGFDVEVGLDWMDLVGWLADRSVLLGDLLISAMHLNGDVTALSAIDGARVSSGLAWGDGVGRQVRGANVALMRHLAVTTR